MENEIAQAVGIIRKSPNVDDEGLHRAFIEAGIERKLAARLIEFLPAAYCRVLLEQAGPRFSDTYQRRRKDGTNSPPIDLSSDPVWTAAFLFARTEGQKGVSREDQLKVASRSAEFHVINKLMKDGSKLGNIVLTPALFLWSEEGPDEDSPTAKHAMPWWKRWSIAGRTGTSRI